MRQWHVSCDCLCNKHLLGEHVEHHMFRAILVKGMKTDGYVNDGLLLPGTLEARHNTVAAEMVKRGMNHTSEFPHIATDTWRLGSMDRFSISDNLRELARRCIACRVRIEATRHKALVADVPVGGDYYETTATGSIRVHISGKLIGQADNKARAIVIMERTRKSLRKSGAIWA
jgi:hypothetical protein